MTTTSSLRATYRETLIDAMRLLPPEQVEELLLGLDRACRAAADEAEAKAMFDMADALGIDPNLGEWTIGLVCIAASELRKAHAECGAPPVMGDVRSRLEDLLVASYGEVQDMDAFIDEMSQRGLYVLDRGAYDAMIRKLQSASGDGGRE